MKDKNYFTYLYTWFGVGIWELLYTWMSPASWVAIETDLIRGFCGAACVGCCPEKWKGLIKLALNDLHELQETAHAKTKVKIWKKYFSHVKKGDP